MNIRKDMKKIKKDVKGITLIALVVTIIVLLILAGIALNLTIGENGLFTRAKNAVEIYENSSIKEQSDLNSLADEIMNNIDTEMSNEKRRYLEMINKLNNLEKIIIKAEEELDNISNNIQNIRAEIVMATQDKDTDGKHQDTVNQYLENINNIANNACYEEIYLLNGFLETPLEEIIDDYNWTLQIHSCKVEDLEIDNLNVLDNNNIGKIYGVLEKIDSSKNYLGSKQNQISIVKELYSIIYEIISENSNMENVEQEIAKQALAKLVDALMGAKQLAITAGNGINTDTDRENLKNEAMADLEVIDIIANNLKINNKHLLNGDFDKIQNVNLNALGNNGEKLTVNFDSTENINKALNDIDNAITIIEEILNSL